MATMTKHAPGTFCWAELGTTDQSAAKKFYGGLFGWTFNDNDMGPQGVYTIFQNQGQDCAALYTLMPDMLQKGVPPNWGAYVAVTSADETAKKVAALGGTVMMEPFDVMDHGRMAVIQDPTGAVFSLWQAKSHPGVGVLREPGALCWTELMTSDTAKAGAFYKSLIGWGAQEVPMGPMTYTMFKLADGTDAGGMMKLTPDMKGVPPHWMNYFRITDLQASVAKATGLGATVLLPPTPVPNVGQFAILKDPQGAAFGLHQAQ